LATILVTGASGFVARHTVPLLIGDGHRIVALTRTRAAGETVRDRLTPERRSAIELREGDVTRPDSLRGAFSGVDSILHLAAIPKDRRRGAELRLVNTEGTRNLVVAAKAAGIRRFVHLGAMGVEDDPNLRYASSKAKAERAVTESDLAWTILKPSLMWGEGDGFFNLIADLVRTSPGVVPIPARSASRFQPLWVGDLGKVVLRCFQDEGATVRRSFPLGGPRYWTYREMVEEVLRALGAPRAIVPVPQILIRLVARSAETVGLPFPVATDQLRQLAFDNIGPITSVRDSFRFEPRAMDGNLGYLKRKRTDQQAVAPAAGA
jgi:uncharacterized protein YbjT (DUF2867 family)